MYFSIFRSPVLGPVISAVFLERLLYLSLSFPKQFYLSDMTDSEWNGTWKTSHYFSYQKVKLLGGNKTTYTMSLYLQKKSIRVCFSQTIWKWDHKNLGKLSPPVPSNPLTLLQLSSRTSRGMRINVYFYPLTNPCFLFSFGIKNFLSGNLMSPGLLLFR